MKKRAIALVVLGLALPFAVEALKSGCTPTRLKLAGTLMICRMKVYATSIRRDTTFASALAACDASFDTRWQTALATYGDCPSVDEPSVLATIRDCTDMVANLIVGRSKIVFASSLLLVPSYPDFTYPEGGDARCQQLANQSSLSSVRAGTFKALLCGTSPDIAPGVPQGVRDRFTPSLGGYIDTLGNPIAESLDDMLDGTITNTITNDENGTPIVIGGGREYAWTGCQADGSPHDPTYLCQFGTYSWTTGHVGTTGGKGHLLSTTGGTFIDSQLEACNAPLHLICVEQ